MSEMTQGPTSSPSVPGSNWAAGWYGDPWYPGQQRFWDGGAWTTYVQTVAGGQAPAAPGADPSAPAWASGSSADPFAPPWASGSSATGGGWLATDHGAPPPPRHRRRGLGVAVAVVVVAVAATAITVASGSGERTRRAVTGPAVLTLPSAPPPTIPPAVSSDPGAGVLSGLDVAQADVPAAYAVTLLQGGNLVAGQVTLDLCNGSYPSESLRTARRQVDLGDRGGRLWLSTEAVLYASSAATAQAFAELRARAASCPQTFLPPPAGERGLPASKTTFNAAPDGTWAKTPSVDRLAYDFTTVDQQGNSSHSIAVYLRRGRVLMGVYFANPGQTQPAIGGKTTVAGIVGVFEQRLAHLPAGVVNATVSVPPPSGSV